MRLILYVVVGVVILTLLRSVLEAVGKAFSAATSAPPSPASAGGPRGQAQQSPKPQSLKKIRCAVRSCRWLRLCKKPGAGKRTTSARRSAGISSSGAGGRLLALSDAVQLDQIGAALPADGLPGHKDDVVVGLQAAGIDQHMLHLEQHLIRGFHIRREMGSTPKEMLSWRAIHSF